MVVDQQLVLADAPSCMTGEMDLVDRVRRDLGQECVEVQPEVVRVHVRVVDVEQQPATRTLDDRGQKRAFGQGRVLERDVGAQVLDQHLATEEVLQLAHARRQVLDGLLGVGQRQQVVEMLAVDVGPASVFADEVRLETTHGVSHPAQVLAVERVRRAEAQPDSVQAQRVGRANTLECAHRGPAVVEVVFGVGFQPADVGHSVQDCLVVRRSQADPGARRNRPAAARAWLRCPGHVDYLALAAASSLPPAFSHSAFGA